MFRELNSKLIDLKKKIRREEKLKKRVKKINAEINEEKQRLDALEMLLNKEERDVKKLEKVNVDTILATISGKKKTRLEKEKKDCIVAKLKYDESKLMIKNLLKQKEIIIKKLEEFKDVRSDYSKILGKKEQMIKRLKGEDSYRDNLKLIELGSIIADKESDVRELEEAILAGNNVLESIQNLMKFFNNKNKIGFFENLFKSSVKEKTLENIKELIYTTQKCINIYKRELADVTFIKNSKLETTNLEPFTKISQLFLDDLFAKYYINKNISTAMTNGMSLSSDVQIQVDILLQEEEKIKEELKKLKEEYILILEDAE